MNLTLYAFHAWVPEKNASKSVLLPGPVQFTVHIPIISTATRARALLAFRRMSTLFVRIGFKVIDHIHCPRVLYTLGVIPDEPIVADGEVWHLVWSRETLLIRLVPIRKVRVYVRTDSNLDPAVLHLCNRTRVSSTKN